MSAQVYTKTPKGIYYVKVSFPHMGMYINSITARESVKYPEKGMWVQMPSFKVGRWITVIEFENGSELKDLIEDEVLRAVDVYNNDANLYSSGELADLAEEG